jgi:uncharacterized protein (DUF427 family)
MDLLVPSRTYTYCTYKGTASHWTAEVDGSVVRDVAWSYDEPQPECAPIAGMLSFYPERATMVQDVLSWFSVPAVEQSARPADAARGTDYERSHG